MQFIERSFEKIIRVKRKNEVEEEEKQERIGFVTLDVEFPACKSVPVEGI